MTRHGAKRETVTGVAAQWPAWRRGRRGEPTARVWIRFGGATAGPVPFIALGQLARDVSRALNPGAQVHIRARIRRGGAREIETLMYIVGRRAGP